MAIEIYGIPEDLDLDWVRSFLRPLALRPMGDKGLAAAILHRLDRIPGVTYPSWLQILYFERSLVTATILVGLCICATLSARKRESTDVP